MFTIFLTLYTDNNLLCIRRHVVHGRPREYILCFRLISIAVLAHHRTQMSVLYQFGALKSRGNVTNPIAWFNRPCDTHSFRYMVEVSIAGLLISATGRCFLSSSFSSFTASTGSGSASVCQHSSEASTAFYAYHPVLHISPTISAICWR